MAREGEGSVGEDGEGGGGKEREESGSREGGGSKVSGGRGRLSLSMFNGSRYML